MAQAEAPRSEFPVSIVMERDRMNVGQWQLPRWRLLGFLAGEEFAEAGRQRIHSQEGREQYLISGFRLRLYRDSAESYWYNLVGHRPSLFLVCRAEEDGALSPFVVTANYDEAGAYMEADDAVFSAPIPPEIYRWIEAFVLDNYRPQEKKQRKRKNWAEESQYGEGQRHQVPGRERG